MIRTCLKYYSNENEELKICQRNDETYKIDDGSNVIWSSSNVNKNLIESNASLIKSNKELFESNQKL